MIYVIIILSLLVIGWFFYDWFQKQNAVIRNFPIIGRLRYVFIKLGPPLRQYLIASNRDELPFNRSQRNWIDDSSKLQNNYEGFGTDKDLYNPGHVFINPKNVSIYPTSKSH